MIYIYNYIISILLTLIPFYFFKKDKDKLFIRIIYIYHLFFFIFNFYYKDFFPSDVNGYFQWAEDINYKYEISKGTSSIVFLIKFLGNIFKFSEINIHLIFSLFGFFGIYMFYKIINEKQNDINKLIFLIPTFHFFSSTVGKDSLMLFFLSLLLYTFINKKFFTFCFIIFLVSLVRYHVAILFSFLAIVIFFENYFYILKRYFKSYLIIKFLIILIIIIGSIYFFSDRLNVFFNLIVDTILHRQSFYNLGNSGYDVQNLNIIQMILYYLFSPFGINFNKNIFFIGTGIENIFLFLYFLISLIYFQFKKIKIFNSNFFIIIFVILYLAFMSFVNTNLGVSTRQKWMIMPFIFYIFSIYCNYPKIKK